MNIWIYTEVTVGLGGSGRGRGGGGGLQVNKQFNMKIYENVGGD